MARGTLTVSVNAWEAGEVEADTEVRVVPRVSGILQRLLVEEGDRVRAGQVVALLDRDEASVEVEQALSGVRSAEARLRQAAVAVELQERQSAADLARARAAVSGAQQASQAAEARARVQPEQTRIAIRQAQARAQAAAAALDLAKRGAREEQIAQARAALEQAEAAATEARRSHARTAALYQEGAVALAQVDSAEARLRSAEAAVSTAREQLALLENQTLPEELRAAEARLDEASEALAAAQAASVQDELQRRDAQAAADRLAEAKAQLRSALAGLRLRDLRIAERTAAAAALRQARAALRHARTRFGYTTVRAPVSGLVSQISAKEGEFVLGGTAFGLGTSQLSILSIINERLLWVRGAIDEADLPKVRLGQPALIHSDAFPRHPFRGRVVEIAPTAQALKLEARTFRVKAAVEGAGGKLRPGMSADLEILVEQVPGALIVPTRAVMIRRGRRYVYLSREGRAVLQPVTVGSSSVSQMQVLSGLRVGDRVITTVDAEGLREGCSITEETG